MNFVTYNMHIQKLARDPNGFRINCCSFQQDALITHGSFQFVALYVPQDSNADGARVTTVGRRNLNSEHWEFVVFQDYIQIKDDGHNVISMGISGDGTIHLAWDMHNDSINYRKSQPGLAQNLLPWNANSFSEVINGLESPSGKFYEFSELTYPRFLTVANGDLLMEFREGRSGLGDCAIYRFSCEFRNWQLVATYIKGVQNNAYVHGFDYYEGVLHVTWTYRDFVDDSYELGKTVSSQAGPNGPENNHDLHYIYSPDEGISWYNSENQKLSVPIDIHQQTLAMEIPKFSGIMNQEGQCVDSNGVHVLGREFGKYYHYYKSHKEIKWNKKSINNLDAKLFGARGKLVSRDNTLYALLPLENDKFVVLTSSNRVLEDTWTTVYEQDGLDGEPIYDRYSQKVSFLQRESTGTRNVVWMELDGIKN